MTALVRSAAAMPAIMLGLFGLYTLEFGVVGILPMIVDRFGITVSQAGWLMAVFALVVATLGPVLVLISSRYDRKKVLVASLFGFAVCSALAAYAPNFPSLMALRVVPALLHPVFLSAAFTAAASLYPKEQRAHALALAFVGTSMGLVLGVPATTWVADHVSYEASFLFCTALTGLSGVGLWMMLPSQGKPVAMSFGHQLSVLRKPALWLTMAATVTIFTAMFSVYSYAAEYLKRETGMDATTISLILVIFGVGGVLGNLFAGRLLARHLVKTTLLHPVALGAAYLVLYFGGSANVLSMAVIAVLWGAAHTSGLLVSQMWLTSETAEAPEFGTSLFVSAANGGVVLGSALGGVFIDHLGIAGVIGCGLIFCALSVAVIAAKAWRYREAPPRIGPVSAVH
ncbi:MFS transporter [Pandoraea sp. PE-S2R-1]|uniref:MFS transporter n=1 Tax=Pandoraea sp. PE-S2R-1 TaxID=1986994 RepID=UPI001BAFC767|nr:MFS transporter [Pandoraea sp. PE-S2R-1]